MGRTPGTYCCPHEDTLARFLSAAPAMMSTPLGLLPVNSDGMRVLVDELVKVRAEILRERNKREFER